MTLQTEAGKESGAKYDWAGARHGLVTLKKDGSRAALIPGHAYALSVEAAAVKVEEAIVRALN